MEGNSTYPLVYTGVRFDLDFLKGAQASRLWAANCSVWFPRIRRENEHQPPHGRDGQAPFFRAAIKTLLGGQPALHFRSPKASGSWYYFNYVDVWDRLRLPTRSVENAKNAVSLMEVDSDKCRTVVGWIGLFHRPTSYNIHFKRVRSPNRPRIKAESGFHVG